MLFENLPHSELIQNTRVDRITSVLALSFKRDYKARLGVEASKIKEISKKSYPGVSIDSIEVENLRQTINILTFLMNSHKEAKERLILLGKQAKEFPYISSVPGIGDQIASQIIAELGDISRFRSYKQINAYCGLDPSIYQSGKAFYNGRISKSGNPYARKILYSTVLKIVAVSRLHYKNHPIEKYYSKKKEKENKSTKASVISTSTKLIRILFSLCKYESTFTF